MTPSTFCSTGVFIEDLHIVDVVHMVNKKHALIGFTLILAVIVPTIFITKTNAQQIGNQEILMANMTITATLGTDCDTSLIVRSDVWNIGISEYDYFDMRIDVRSLNVSSALLNGTVVETTIIPQSNYMVVRIYSGIPMSGGSFATLLLNLTTQCLQEHIGLNEDQSMHLSHRIDYISWLIDNFLGLGIHVWLLSRTSMSWQSLPVNKNAICFHDGIVSHSRAVGLQK